jgi:hypothetical protein
MRDYLKKNEPADDSKINGFDNNYNHTNHKETCVSPIQMQKDKTFEVNYMISKLKEQANVENQPEYKLNIGDKGR